MSNDYIKLAEAPVWCIQYPMCSACDIDLTHDGDGWLCESCGTAWSGSANDGEVGELFEEWSGEKPEGPAASPDQAWKWGNYIKALDQHRLFPKVYSNPRRPTDEELMGR